MKPAAFNYPRRLLLSSASSRCSCRGRRFGRPISSGSRRTSRTRRCDSSSPSSSFMSTSRARTRDRLSAGRRRASNSLPVDATTQCDGEGAKDGGPRAGRDTKGPARERNGGGASVAQARALPKAGTVCCQLLHRPPLMPLLLKIRSRMPCRGNRQCRRPMSHGVERCDTDSLTHTILAAESSKTRPRAIFVTGLGESAGR
jgi:hypothetical protein